MYQMSQLYIPSIPSKLEYLVLSSSGAITYAASEITSSSTYDFGMFIPPNSGFQYSSHDSSIRAYQTSLQSRYQFASFQREYHFDPSSFLKPGKEGIFVGKSEEIKEFIQDAFEKVCGYPLPTAFKISICKEKQFRFIALSPNTVGLSINRSQQGLLSEIFVLEGSMGRVMLTLGHEIGHVLTRTLPDPVDEEAKAYAFSLAWIKIIQEHNIAGLQDALITEVPAVNGLHNVAFAFVQQFLKQGMEAWEIYQRLIKNLFREKCEA